MKCPNCGSDAGFESRADWSMSSETGYVQGEWLECRACGAETDYQELGRIEEQQNAAIYRNVKEGRNNSLVA